MTVLHWSVDFFISLQAGVKSPTAMSQQSKSKSNFFMKNTIKKYLVILAIIITGCCGLSSCGSTIEVVNPPSYYIVPAPNWYSVYPIYAPLPRVHYYHTPYYRCKLYYRPHNDHPRPNNHNGHRPPATRPQSFNGHRGRR